MRNHAMRNHAMFDHAMPRPPLKRRLPVQLLVEILVVIICVYTFVNLATVRYVVDGSSMEPNLRHGELLLASRLHYLFGEPARGDIVVFHNPLNPSEDYVKRVVGVPGDTITIDETLIFVNGELLIEGYIAEPCDPSRCPNGIWTLGADEYFVMGDNRNNSNDSRFFTETVRREHLIGKVLLRYWPLNQWGMIG